MYLNVDLTFKNLQFCFANDKQAHICFSWGLE